LGVNYRHAFHAGNPADALKHALLVVLMRALQRKDTGFLFLDTHAGRGRYDLSLASRGDSRSREPEWPEGIGRLWEATGLPPALADYVALVRAHDRSRGNLGNLPRFYPGSPRIARDLARAEDRLELWERHPAECAALRREFEGERRVAVHGADGYGSLRACLPPRERRALVLIDPPFESQGEWSSASSAVADALQRFPAGTYAVWYPLTERARADAFLAALAQLGAPALAAELVMGAGSPGLRGCGVAVVNPPWRFEDEAAPVAGYLARALSRDAKGQESLRWIVPR
jgi:23S rRNA (adenine2030-N6)-methyltransferase